MSPPRRKPNRLGALRTERHLTQSVFARGVGISRDRALRIEGRTSKATDDELEQFVMFLNVHGARYGLAPITKAALGLEALPKSQTFRVRASRSRRRRHPPPGRADDHAQGFSA